MTEKDESLPANVLEAMRQGNALEAVKLLCESTGFGLMESRDIIYQHLQAPPPGRSCRTRLVQPPSRFGGLGTAPIQQPHVVAVGSATCRLRRLLLSAKPWLVA